jgi:hypothetical protein
MSQPQYISCRGRNPNSNSSQPTRSALVDQAEFDADMAYLRGMADTLFEHASAPDLMRIAAGAGVTVP